MGDSCGTFALSVWQLVRITRYGRGQAVNIQDTRLDQLIVAGLLKSFLVRNCFFTLLESRNNGERERVNISVQTFSDGN